MRLAFAIAIGFLGACTFGRLEGLTGGDPAIDSGDADIPTLAPDPPGDRDASSTDTPDAASEAATTTTTLLLESFEDDRGGSCQGTGYGSAYLPQRSRAHTGETACMVCQMGSDTSSFSYYALVPNAVVEAGTRYRAKAWLKIQQTGFPSGDTTVALRSTLQNGTAVETASSGNARLTGDWRPLEVDFTPTKAADLLDVYVAQTSGAGFCFVVDDIEVTRTR